jgi:hypothetical protein
MNGRTDDARNIRRRGERLFSGDSLLGPAEEPPLASHLVTPRSLYSHHGIYVGNGSVIHYGGLARGLHRGPVEEVSLADFARGRNIRVRHDLPFFDRREVVARARSRLGERSYRILTNNCEHFCARALQGESRSRQVECLRAALPAVWRAIRAACFVWWQLDSAGPLIYQRKS